MKKLSLVLILGMLLGLTACGGETTQDETKGATDAQTESSVDNVENTEDEQADTDEDDKDLVSSVAENFTYTEENGEITITGYEGEATVLEIPDSINGMPVVAIGENAFANTEGIEEVILPDSVVLIGKKAFEGCSNLNKVTFGVNLEVIDGGAFWRTALESVEFPDTVHTIGSYAFCGTNIKEVTIPSQVTVITGSSFALTQVEELVIPASVTTIEKQAFEGNLSLRTIVVEEGVEVIEEEAFANCTMVESITFPTTLTELDERVVSGSGSDGRMVYLYVPAGSVAESVLTTKYPDSKYYEVVTQ